MKWILAAILALALPCLAAEQKEAKGLSDFFVDWCGMCNMALNDHEASSAALLLLKTDRTAADFVARFWRHRAMAACQEYRNEVMEIHSRKVSPSMTSQERDALRDDLMREISLILMSYYYDHAAEIKAMIDTRLQVAAGDVKASLKQEP